MGQLGRILLSGSSGSPDEQSAAPEEQGGYGELMEQIDQLTGPVPAKDARETDS
jgi:hypothetical protein